MYIYRKLLQTFISEKIYLKKLSADLKGKETLMGYSKLVLTISIV